MKTNENFKKLLNTPNVKFTVILGSGFHCQALGSNSLLSNWEKLLKALDTKLNITGFYPLDFEQIIVRRTGIQKNEKNKDKAAFEIEKEISEEISFKLKTAQEKALKSKKRCYPTTFFNPSKVSDIISLNFDSTAEEICLGLAKQQKAIFTPSIFNSAPKEKLVIPCWDVNFKNNEKIRFWYPHGSIHNNDKITLGTREYAKRIQTIERLRKHSKSCKEDNPTSWYHQITHNPILILGAEISKDEWDIWFAIVNRERNFAKNKHQQFKYPIFQMREYECNKNIHHEWFEPLFTGMSFQEQWEELEQLFKNKII